VWFRNCMGCGAIVSIRAGDAGDAICCEEEYPGAKPRGQDAPYQSEKKRIAAASLHFGISKQVPKIRPACASQNNCGVARAGPCCEVNRQREVHQADVPDVNNQLRVRGNLIALTAPINE